MKIGTFLTLLFVGFIVVGVIGSNRTPQQRAVTTAAPRPPDCISGPRNEAIKAIAWIAGNMGKSSLWPDLAPFLAQGTGEYYQHFMRLAAPGSNHETEAIMNLALYREWFAKGEADPINQREATDRTRRVVQIIDEVGACLRTMRRPV